jgi:hypothetical protein
MDDGERNEWGDDERVEALQTERLPDDDGVDDTADDYLEAIEDGLPYSPPETAPVLPGGEDDAFMATELTDGATLILDVLEALDANPATTNLQLQVELRGDVVVLRGRVRDAADAEGAVGTALSVPGIEDVVDEIELEAE